MMKKCSVIFLILISLIFPSCASDPMSQRTKTYYQYFDTVLTVIGHGNVEDFSKTCGELEKIFEKYHKLFDIYEDGNTLGRVNASAGKGAVAVPEELLDAIEFSQKMYAMTEGECNVAFGAVLSIWHDHRERALNGDVAVPRTDVLSAAAEHCDINDIIIDREANTLFLSDPEMSLDLGAVAKGLVADECASYLRSTGREGYAVSVGGTIIAVGGKPNGEAWVVGVEDPDPDSNDAYVARVMLDGGAVATSGSYQRYYECDGVRYHHIIDPDTLYPENEFLSVTIRAETAAVADALSTALFNMTYEEGRDFIESLDGVEALWVLTGGETKTSDGFDMMK